MDILSETARFVRLYRDPRNADDLAELQAIQRAFCSGPEPTTVAECRAMIAVLEIDLEPLIAERGVALCLRSVLSSK